LRAFVGAGRRIGGRSHGVEASPSHTARVFLTLQYSESVGTPAREWICRAYREGDSREKAAVISALPDLDCDADGEPYLALALDCGRTNESDLFACLTAGNDFPSRYYSDNQFNQLVMKAAFSDFDLGQIVGLQARCNPELARMGMEYVDERLAAGRSFPSSLWLAIAPCNPPGACARMLGELQHSQPLRRQLAAAALGLTGDSRVRSFLEERLAMESDSLTKENIESSIERL